jgi:hypothetical protein
MKKYTIITDMGTHKSKNGPFYTFKVNPAILGNESIKLQIVDNGNGEITICGGKVSLEFCYINGTVSIIGSYYPNDDTNKSLCIEGNLEPKNNHYEGTVMVEGYENEFNELDFPLGGI